MGDAVLDYGQRFTIGTVLVQVFSVSISSQRCCQVYGSIRVTDGRGQCLVLYDRDPNNPECIKPDQTTLTLRANKPTTLSALTGFIIDINLSDTAAANDHDHFEINNGNICWNPNDTCYYDKTLSINVPGVNACFATLNCAIFSVAKEAELEILLLSRKSKTALKLNTLEIYGTLVASYGRMFDFSTTHQTTYFQTTLFDQPPDHCMELKLGEPIPLLRSLVAIPAHSSLIITANLYLRDTAQPILTGSTSEILPAMYMDTDIVGDTVIARVGAGWRCPIG